MRKVIGIGETILDIIFRGDQPSAAVPGGSVFNGIVSLGRMGINVGFISETGNDRVGNIILQFMRENHIPTDHVNVFPDGKSPVSLLVFLSLPLVSETEHPDVASGSLCRRYIQHRFAR